MARLSIGSTFLVHAFLSGSWAPRMPAIKQDLGLDESDLGIALLGFAIGLVAGTRLGGRSADRLGTRLPLRLGLPVQCFCLVGLALAWDLPSLTAAFVLFGVVSGFLDVTMNANAVAVERGCARPILSGLHGLWSVGLLAGAVAGTGAAALGLTPGAQFWVVAAVLAAVSIFATRDLLLTPAHRTPPAATSSGKRWSGFSLNWLPPALIAFGSFAGEGSAADWSAVYLDETVGTGAGAAGLAFVAFSLGMIASRFSADRATARFGPRLVVRSGGLIAAGGLALALASPHVPAVVAGYLLFGVGLAPIVPIAFSAAGNLDGVRTGAALSSVVTVGYVGSVVGPIVIGFTADALSLRLALVLPVLLALLISSLASSVANAAGGAPELESAHADDRAGDPIRRAAHQ